MSDLVFGNVKHPEYTRHIIWNSAWDDLGPRHNYGVVYHRMLGSLMGTDQYFAGGAAALTGYGTGHPGDHDGEIIMWCDPLTDRAPWASGPVIAPWGDGPAFVNAYGENAVNNDLIAIEISGNYDDPISQTTIETVAALTAYWADQARIPWNQYPIHPVTGLTYTYWHQEFTGPQEKICPGSVVMANTQAIIDRTQAILKAAQTVAAPVEAPPPDEPKQPTPSLLPLPHGMSWKLVARLFDHAKDPDGKEFRFDKERAACQVWFNTAIRSIPKGQSWKKGNWPQITDIIRRGNGSLVYTWSDGSTYVSQSVADKAKKAA